MEVGLRVPLDAEMSSPGSAVLPARLLLDVARSLPADQLTLELRAAEQDVELISGPRHVPPAHAPRRGLPDAAGASAGERDRAARPRRSCRRSSPRRPLGLARRDPPGPHRHPDDGLRPGAADGRHRLLPPGVKQTALEAAAAGQPRGQRPGPRAAGAGADRAAGRARHARRQRRAEPGRLRARRHRALLAPDRRPVPQLPPAAARSPSSTSCASRAPSSARWCAGSACWRRRTRRCGSPSARASSPSRPRRPTSARPGDDPRAPSTARPSRSASTPSSCATASRASSPTSWC